MTMDAKRRKKVVSDAVRYARDRRGEDPYDPAYDWMVKLHAAYPNDPGVLSPMILNLICLKPGQAMYLPAGEPHAYLDGLGIELMANSDNVLRGGLTPKHVDVPELLKVLSFDERDVQILSPHPVRACEREYSSPAEDFILSVVKTEPGLIYESPENRSIEILICTRGTGSIVDSASGKPTGVTEGVSVVIPSAVEKYRIDGDATLYKSSVPI
jgi:mannose-6-phosphate isomerase